MKLKIGNQVINMPDFFVVGAPKCGTTSLYDYLKMSTKLFLPEIKEPQFFAYKNLGNQFKSVNSPNNVKTRNFIIHLKDYQKLFLKASNNQIIGDFSTHYLRYSNSFIENIKEVYGDRVAELKIIILLRDPIDRAFSHYTMRLRDNNENLTFREAVNPKIIEDRLKDNYLPSYDYLRFSQYKKDIDNLKNTFPLCKIYHFKDFITDTENVLKDLSSFLEIQDDLKIILNQNFQESNISGVPKRGILNHVFFTVIFRKNLIKSFIPVKIRKRYRSQVKTTIGKKLMFKPKITSSEREYLESLLCEEIETFENFKY